MTLPLRNEVGGDPDDFAALYRTYFRDVRDLCARLTRDRNCADDFAHETFERALRHAHRFDHSRNVWPWLQAIARNVCIDELRRRRALPGTLPDFADDSPLPDDQAIRTRERRLARRALARAMVTQSPRDRTVLWHRDVEERSYEEIAYIDGRSPGTIRNVASRVRRELKNLLAEDRARGNFGLGPAVIPWLRAAFGRIKRRLSDFTSHCMGVAAFADMVVVGLAGLALVAVSLADGSPRLRAPTRSEVQGTVSQADSPALTRRQARTGSNPRHALAEAWLESTPPSEGSVIGKHHRLYVVVYGPDGRRIFTKETEADCDGQGWEFLPRNGPVRAGCG